MNTRSTLMICTVLFFSALSSHASAQSAEDFQVEQSDVLFQLRRTSYIEEFSTLLNQAQIKHDTSYKLSSATIADSCIKMMSKDNFTGPTGTRISNFVLQHNDFFPRLKQGGSLNRYCPKYSNMNTKQKSLVWVLLLTVIAHFESTCNQSAHAKGPNGTAYGYFQLHAGQEQNYDGDMNLCRKNDSRDPVLASQCTLSMLEYQFQKNRGELFNNNSYWDVLRPNGYSQKAGVIQRALTQFSLCNPVVL